ncbi:hypothetical protein R1sor_020183 [Riccia sorocarpa]|uniref:Uncharacterized protein n=1 Tax=Riccia sorocarpa TaxID=122646 RepID=A0ABD3IIW5_9MARC
MTVGLSKQGMKKLQKTTRDFLWGQNDMGKNKQPLIAWSTFEKKKERGGLGWPPLTDMADAFLVRNVIKIITGSSDEWVKIAEEIIKHTLNVLTRHREIKTWKPAEVLLGLDSFRTPASPTLDRMFKKWFKIRKKHHQAPLLLMLTILRYNWMERNHSQFRNKRKYTQGFYRSLPKFSRRPKHSSMDDTKRRDKKKISRRQCKQSTTGTPKRGDGIPDGMSYREPSIQAVKQAKWSSLIFS